MIVFVNIVVPSGIAFGAPVSVAHLQNVRTLQFEGSSGPVVIEQSANGTDWAPLATFLSEGARDVVNNALLLRANRQGGEGPTTVTCAAEEITAPVPGPAGPTAFGDAGFEGSATTPDAVAADVGTPFAPGVDGTFSVLSHVNARQVADGASGVFYVQGLFTRIAGVVAQVGATQAVSDPILSGGFAPGGVILDASANTIRVRATGIVDSPISWKHNSVILIN